MAHIDGHIPTQAPQFNPNTIDLKPGSTGNGPSVSQAQAANASDNQTTAGLFGSPEVPGVDTASFGGGSFLAILVEAQKILAKGSFENKVIARDQMFKLGYSKADTITGQADDMREGATWKFATTLAASAVQLAGYAGSLGYMKFKSNELALQKNKQGIKDIATDVRPSTNTLSDPASPAASRGSSARNLDADNNLANQPTASAAVSQGAGGSTQPKQANASGGANSGGANNGANGQNRNNVANNRRPLGGQATELGDADIDAQFVSPVMQAIQGTGTATGTMISASGEYKQANHSADAKEKEAQGTIYDAQSGFNNQIMSDMSQFEGRAKQFLSATISQIYSTNTTIIGGISR